MFSRQKSNIKLRNNLLQVCVFRTIIVFQNLQCVLYSAVYEYSLSVQVYLVTGQTGYSAGYPVSGLQPDIRGLPLFVLFSWPHLKTYGGLGNTFSEHLFTSLPPMEKQSQKNVLQFYHEQKQLLLISRGIFGLKFRKKRVNESPG